MKRKKVKSLRQKLKKRLVCLVNKLLDFVPLVGGKLLKDSKEDRNVIRFTFQQDPLAAVGKKNWQPLQ